ncbi:sodium:solute symporter [Bythopirellula goksoeyrii]|uniref:Sodium/glucose cotransporter n=1 Tax=Bythopirellula goksoeyrii TaxID=1400387 RepID=A0A5B9QG04_9BACT|nr:sodium:solute symporter [Bythopirellula goksoeyrii]QEG36502.1 Sodium/glucose cotransporter [Bythopirellula goksoeyrii]
MVALDWMVVAGYFALLLVLAWWVINKSKNTSSDYFLAGHSLGWFIVGASIFASNIGSEHLVGLAGSGATDGVALAHYELHAWCLLVLAWVLVPFYSRSRVFTMPEFLERRFSPASRYVLSIISLVAYIVTKIAVGIFAGGIVFGVLLPEMRLGPFDSFWIGSILVLVITGIYTTLGGFRAVAYTEALQTFILIAGSAMVTYYGLEHIGGWAALRENLGSEAFNLWKPLVPAGVEGTWAPVEVVNEAGQLTKQAWYFNGNYPWLGMLFCAPIIGLWYWCTDQYIVQRALGADSETNARRGSIFAGLLKLLPVFIFIVPGMICLALAKSGDIEGLRSLVDSEGEVVRDQAQAAFPLMVQHVLPAGVRGIVVAGLLSALMSSLAGVFNACSTLFTIDLYSKKYPNASEADLVRIGRRATLAMVLVGLAWIPVIKGSRGLYDYLQSVQGYLAPPIFVVFFLGIFWKRLNAQGCLWALIVGFLMGIFRLAVDTLPKVKEGFEYTEGSLFWIVNKIYFQYFSLLIFIVSSVVMIVVSLMTRAPDYERISGITYGTLTDAQRSETRSSWSMLDVVASVALVASILVAYLFFRG